MIQKASYIVLTLAAIVLAYSSLTGRLTHEAPVGPATPALQVGVTAPALMLRSGAADSLPAAVPGQETLLVLFSTACAYCLASLPVYRKLAGTRCDLALTFVIVDRKEAEVGRWWAENAWRPDDAAACAPVTVGAPTASISAFGRLSTPTHYLLDGRRRVVHSEVGFLRDIPEWLAKHPSKTEAPQ